MVLASLSVCRMLQSRWICHFCLAIMKVCSPPLWCFNRFIHLKHRVLNQLWSHGTCAAIRSHYPSAEHPISPQCRRYTAAELNKTARLMREISYTECFRFNPSDKTEVLVIAPRHLCSHTDSLLYETENTPTLCLSTLMPKLWIHPSLTCRASEHIQEPSIFLQII